jgi:hypothetical protein
VTTEFSGSRVSKVVLLSVTNLEPSLLVQNDENLDDGAIEMIILKCNFTVIVKGKNYVACRKND